MSKKRLEELALTAGETPSLEKIDAMLHELSKQTRCANVTEIEDRLLDLRTAFVQHQATGQMRPVA